MLITAYIKAKFERIKVVDHQKIYRSIDNPIEVYILYFFMLLLSYHFAIARMTSFIRFPLAYCDVFQYKFYTDFNIFIGQHASVCFYIYLYDSKYDKYEGLRKSKLYKMHYLNILFLLVKIYSSNYLSFLNFLKYHISIDLYGR